MKNTLKYLSLSGIITAMGTTAAYADHETHEMGSILHGLEHSSLAWIAAGAAVLAIGVFAFRKAAARKISVRKDDK